MRRAGKDELETKSESQEMEPWCRYPVSVADDDGELDLRWASSKRRHGCGDKADSTMS